MIAPLSGAATESVSTRRCIRSPHPDCDIHRRSTKVEASAFRTCVHVFERCLAMGHTRPHMGAHMSRSTYMYDVALHPKTLVPHY